MSDAEFNPPTPVAPKSPESAEPYYGDIHRWELLRDLFVFQGKLILDGLRDLLLSPVSLVLAILDLTISGSKPGRRFYDLMHLGRQSDVWINLFGASQRVPMREDWPEDDRSVDMLVERLEEKVKRQYAKGGVTASAKESVDHAFDTIQKHINATRDEKM
jgi:hypothetical protein